MGFLLVILMAFLVRLGIKKQKSTKAKMGAKKNKKMARKTIKTKKRRRQVIFTFFVRSDRFFGVFGGVFRLVLGVFRLSYKHLLRVFFVAFDAFDCSVSTFRALSRYLFGGL